MDVDEPKKSEAHIKIERETEEAEQERTQRLVWSLRQFEEDNRPAWFGVDRRKSAQINGRNPFKCATDVDVNYDTDDSGVEWYDEPDDAEDLLCSDGSEEDELFGTGSGNGNGHNGTKATMAANSSGRLDGFEDDGFLISNDDKEFGDRELLETCEARKRFNEIHGEFPYSYKHTGRHRGDCIDAPIVVVIPSVRDMKPESDPKAAKYLSEMKLRVTYVSWDDDVPHSKQDNIIVANEEEGKEDEKEQEQQKDKKKQTKKKSTGGNPSKHSKKENKKNEKNTENTEITGKEKDVKDTDSEDESIDNNESNKENKDAIGFKLQPSITTFFSRTPVRTNNKSHCQMSTQLMTAATQSKKEKVALTLTPTPTPAPQHGVDSSVRPVFGIKRKKPDDDIDSDRNGDKVSVKVTQNKKRRIQPTLVCVPDEGIQPAQRIVIDLSMEEG